MFLQLLHIIDCVIILLYIHTSKSIFVIFYFCLFNCFFFYLFFILVDKWGLIFLWWHGGKQGGEGRAGVGEEGSGGGAFGGVVERKGGGARFIIISFPSPHKGSYIFNVFSALRAVSY